VDGEFTTGASLNVTIVDSEVSNNFSIGVDAVSASGHAATTVFVRNSVASYNNFGLAAQNGILLIAHSVVTGNNTGVTTFSGGTLFSYGDNDINGNTNNNFLVLTPLAMH
jgi:hypothetical protein